MKDCKFRVTLNEYPIKCLAWVIVSLGWTFLFFPLSTWAQDINGAGSTSTNFQKIGMGARAVGMGESFMAVADDSTAMFWNPAGLVLARGTQLSQTHGEWMMGVSHESFSFSQNLKTDGALGGSVVYLGTGTFPGTLETSTGSYAGTGFDVSASDFEAGLAYAQRLGRWIPDDFFKKSLLGLRVNLVGQNIINAGNLGFSLDAGYMYEAIRKKLYLGAVFYNIGSQIENFSQPMLIKGGGSYRLQDLFMKKDRLILAAGTEFHNDTGFKMNLGGEYRFLFDQNGIAFRAGYRLPNDLGAVAGITSGVGISHHFEEFEFGLDYAFVPYGVLGDSHRVSWYIVLGGEEFPPSASVKAPSSFTLKDETLKVDLGAKTDEPVQKWKFAILDSNGMLVKTLSGKGNPPSNYVWDGRNELGNLVPEGNYSLNLEITDEDDQVGKAPPVPVYAKWKPKKVPYNYAYQVSGDLLFDSGKDELLPRGYAAIQSTVATLQSRYPDSMIIVAGHTDNVRLIPGARFANNQQLSEARARAVMNYLVQGGMSAQRLSAVGYGDTRPIASNDTPEGKAKNRRVELIVSGVMDASAADMIREGTLFMRDKNYREALNRFLAALEADARNSRAWRFAGDCYLALRGVPQAIAAYRKALEYNPTDMALKAWLDQYGGTPAQPSGPVTAGAIPTPTPLPENPATPSPAGAK